MGSSLEQAEVWNNCWGTMMALCLACRRLCFSLEDGFHCLLLCALRFADLQDCPQHLVGIPVWVLKKCHRILQLCSAALTRVLWASLDFHAQTTELKSLGELYPISILHSSKFLKCFPETEVGREESALRLMDILNSVQEAPWKVSKLSDPALPSQGGLVT